jgi:ribosomal protein S18 acetylase RimI-like enzyme
MSGTSDMAKIEIAAPTDAVAISHIVNYAYRGPPVEGAWTSEFGILDGARVDVPAIERMIAAEATAVLVLHDDDGAVAGCIAVEPHDETLSYLSMLSVDPCRQAKGLGRRLVAAAERYARIQGATRARMTVIHVRQALIDWYLRQGYKPTGETEPFPYGDDTVGVPLRDDLHFIVLEKQLR